MRDYVDESLPVKKVKDPKKIQQQKNKVRGGKPKKQFPGESGWGQKG